MKNPLNVIDKRIVTRVRLNLEVSAADKLRAVSDATGKSMASIIEKFINSLKIK